MAEAQLQQFLEKVKQLNAFVALSEQQPELREALRQCSQHHEVVQLAAIHGFEIGRRWGEEPSGTRPSDQTNLLSSPCPEQGHERTEAIASGNATIPTMSPETRFRDHCALAKPPLRQASSTAIIVRSPANNRTAMGGPADCGAICVSRHQDLAQEAVTAAQQVRPGGGIRQ